MSASNNISALDVAHYFLATNAPNSISNHKLQKLCAYAQAVSVAYLEQPLFTEPIEMWDIGPIIPAVYHVYKKYDLKLIPKENINISLFSMQQRLVLAAINDSYCDLYDACSLCDKSYQDFHLIRGSNDVITISALKKAFDNNHVVQELRRSDAVVINKTCKTISAGEFFHCLGL